MTINTADTRHACADIVRSALAHVLPVFRLDVRSRTHGLPHWSRVAFHGRMLAAELGQSPRVVTWFAFLHDSQRHNDGHDPAHGSRAADFALRLRRRSVIAGLSRHEFECLCEAMRMHSDGYTDAEPLIEICWDADRLDLGRVGIAPDPARLCTPAARRQPVIERAMAMSSVLPRAWR